MRPAYDVDSFPHRLLSDKGGTYTASCPSSASDPVEGNAKHESSKLHPRRLPCHYTVHAGARRGAVHRVFEAGVWWRGARKNWPARRHDFARPGAYRRFAV